MLLLFGSTSAAPINIGKRYAMQPVMVRIIPLAAGTQRDPDMFIFGKPISVRPMGNDQCIFHRQALRPSAIHIHCNVCIITLAMHSCSRRNIKNDNSECNEMAKLSGDISLRASVRF